ncbi:MAG TPA: Bcr/CflA family multidrug efflux MFS transporter [Cyclobacteriaceae bacterium]|nr:Bcr/CflA family multidrug efflux MFS transporter [Cyclobacteriaceae bacterium]
MNKRRETLLVIIMGLMVAVGPFSIDMYLPAFQVIADEFHTTISKVALSMASYFIGMAAGQLLYGPLLDRFGRKPPLYAGLFIYLVATVACILSTSIEQMIAFRFIQAIGGCAASVAANAMVRDMFPVEDNAKIFSSFILVISASPLVAPSLGGFVSVAWGWQSLFLILIIITLLILVLVFLFIPESKGPDPSFSLRPGDILRSFAEVLRVPQFSTYALSGGIAFAGLFVFVSSSPFIYMTLYDFTEKEYGIMFAVLLAGLIGASQLNRLLLKKFSSETLVSWSITIQLVVAALLLLVTFLGMTGIFYIQTALIFLFLATLGIVLPNSTALALAPFSSNAGTAASVLGTLQFGFGALASFVVSFLTADSSLPIVLTMLICSSIALTSLLIGKPYVKVTHSSSATTSSLH